MDNHSGGAENSTACRRLSRQLFPGRPETILRFEPWTENRTESKLKKDC